MLDLSTPNVQPDRRLAGEFRPRTLETWLDQLPRTDRETCLRQLRKALATQNRVTLDPSLRLQLMELYLAPFRELYVLHHSDLRALSRIPLHPHYRTRQTEMLEMLDALASGYKIAAVDSVAARRGQGRDTRLALALQRAMYCLGEVLVTAYELYIRPPGNTWREVHELYRCAEAEDLCGVDLAPVPGHVDLVDILETYVPILLLGASSPHGLLPGEARRLYELIPQWRRSARITTPVELPGDPGHFRFNLDVDAPPLPVSKSTRPMANTTRVLKTLGVARAMHKVLTDMNDATTRKALRKVLGAGAETADLELFRRVGRVFGEVDIKRSSNRVPVRQPLELFSGLDAAYYACNNRRAFEPSMADTPGRALPESASGRSDEQFIDLSEPMLGAPIESDARGGPPTAPESGRHPSQSVTCVNQGAGGLGLVLPRNGDVRLKVGDIAACRVGGASDWQVGVLRWMRVAPREVRVGLQFLGPVAIPVAVVTAAGASAALWLPENPVLRQASSIVLPRTAGPYPPLLEIHGGDDVPAKVRLLGRVERTGDYEQFLVSSLEPSGPASHSSLSS